MLNKVQLIGRVGKDPIIKQLSGDNLVAEFSLATDDSYKDKQGNKVEQTDWHSIKIFGKLAGVVEKYVKKGALLYVEGKIKTRTWDDKDGNRRYTTEIVADTMKMLDGRKDAVQNTGSDNGQIDSSDDDGMPF